MVSTGSTVMSVSARGAREEPLRVVQPALFAVEVQRLGDLAIDAAVRAGSLSGRWVRRPDSTISSRRAWVASLIVGLATGSVGLLARTGSGATPRRSSGRSG